MDRRKAMKMAAGVAVAGGAGLLSLSTAFKSEPKAKKEPFKLDYNQPTESPWQYVQLDPAVSAQVAYDSYDEGSCMYATVKGIISQLAEKIGEPFSSFPTHMFKYGHGGIGGYGTVCGTLNGAAALIGLFVSDKNVQNNLIADLFRWYEQSSLPVFTPQKAVYDYSPTQTTSNSVLCHASNTVWSNASGFSPKIKERKERCSRLSGDVAEKVTTALNQIFTDTYIAGKVSNDEANTCISCHGSEGKVNNTAVKMNCTSCHTKSIGHRVFADVHYKMME